jgi:hypothetical protein
MFKVGDKSKSVTAGKRLRSCGIVSYCVSEPRTIVRKSERKEDEGFAQRVFQSFLHSSAITSGISSGKKRFAVSKRRTPFDPGRFCRAILPIPPQRKGPSRPRLDTS